MVTIEIDSYAISYFLFRNRGRYFPHLGREESHPYRTFMRIVGTRKIMPGADETLGYWGFSGLNIRGFHAGFLHYSPYISEIGRAHV